MDSLISKNFLDRIPSELTGLSFLKHVCLELKEVTGADYVFITELIGDDFEIFQDILYMIGPEGEIPGVRCPVKGTPCELILKNGIATYFEGDFKKIFPTADKLHYFNVKSFLGIPLTIPGCKGQGNIVIMSQECNFDIEQSTITLEQISARCVSELFRHQVEMDHLHQKKINDQLFDIVNAAVCVVSPEGKFLRVNRKFYEMTGYSEEEIIGKNFAHMLQDGNRDIVMSQYGQILGNKMDTHFDCNMYAKDGTKYSMKWNSTLVSDANGKMKCIIGTGIDITEELRLKKIQEEMTKYETLGRFSRNVAHDFNNLLAVSKAYAELIKDNTPKDSATQDYIDKLYNSLGVASDFVRQLMRFAQTKKMTLTPLDLNQLIDDNLPLIEMIKREPVEVYKKLEPRTLRFLGDETEFKRFFMNTFKNAIEAMVSRGHGHPQLSITTDLVNSSQDELPTTIRLTITDNGIGMDENQIAQAFDPFYTTKGTMGTGLGLPVCDSIVKQCGGKLAIHSIKGNGTSVIVDLPYLSAP